MTTANAKTLLPFDQPGARAEIVARRLGDAIRLGLVLNGERLPSEARLARQLGVSTVTLREGLAILRTQGLVATRRGRGGGTFITAPRDRGNVLRRFSVQDLRDLGDQRAAVAGMAAQLAARRAAAGDIRRLTAQLERLGAANSASERRRADTQLAIEIAAAAQSPRLTREEMRLRAEIGDLLWLDAGVQDHAALLRNRSRLVKAIAGRVAARSRRLAEERIAQETTTLISLRLRLAAGA